MTAAALRATDREVLARRLLASSAKASYDPLTAIDWDAPVDASRYAMPPHRLSLYGTALWDQLTEDQRRELSRHELASIAGIGIWFEAILIQMLIRQAFDRDPTTSHVQYAYTEIADECRHSVMFARLIAKLGTPCYRPRAVPHLLAKVFKATSNGPLTFSATLFIEELLDQAQREAMADETIEPLTRVVSKIHVTEEARHLRYAREELIRVWPQAGLLARAHSRIVLAAVVAIASANIIHRDCYATVGLDPKAARRAARRNPHWRASRAWLARQAVETFTAAGLITGVARLVWRRAGLLQPARGQAA